jgi:DNA-directed RNA polymerase subunit RPC12/RpoP
LILCECKCVKCGSLFEFALKDGDKIQRVHCPDCKNPFMVIMTLQDMGNKQLATSVADLYHRVTRIEEFLCAESDEALEVFKPEQPQ